MQEKAEAELAIVSDEQLNFKARHPAAQWHKEITEIRGRKPAKPNLICCSGHFLLNYT